MSNNTCVFWLYAFANVGWSVWLGMLGDRLGDGLERSAGVSSSLSPRSHMGVEFVGVLPNVGTEPGYDLGRKVALQLRSWMTQQPRKATCHGTNRNISTSTRTMEITVLRPTSMPSGFLLAVRQLGDREIVVIPHL